MHNQAYESPSTLVAILVAAKRCGDRELERATRRQLEERHGIKVSFADLLKFQSIKPLEIGASQ